MSDRGRKPGIASPELLLCHRWCLWPSQTPNLGASWSQWGFPFTADLISHQLSKKHWDTNQYLSVPEVCRTCCLGQICTDVKLISSLMSRHSWRERVLREGILIKLLLKVWKWSSYSQENHSFSNSIGLKSSFYSLRKCCRKLTEALRNYTETGSVVVTGLSFVCLKIRTQAVVSFAWQRDFRFLVTRDPSVFHSGIIDAHPNTIY